MITLQNWGKVLSFLALGVVVAVALSTETARVLLSGNLQEMLNISRENILVYMVLTWMFMAIQNLLTLIPVFLLITLNVSVLGFFSGYMWSLICSIVGALMAFLLVRYWLQRLFIRKVNAKWRDQIETRGFWFVFGARLFPFAPTSLINVAAGMSTIKLSHYMFSTVLGNGIFFFILSLVAYGIVSMDVISLYGIVLTVIIAVTMAGVYGWYRQRKRRLDKNMYKKRNHNKN